MSAETPNMVDAALALGTEHPEVGGILSMIADHMAADSAHRQSIYDSWRIQDRASLKATQDGVRFHLAQQERGGTTASYERTMRAIEAVVDEASYDSSLRRWYIDRFTEDEFSHPVHPDFISRGPM